MSKPRHRRHRERKIHRSRFHDRSTGRHSLRRRTLVHEPLEDRVLLAGDITVRFDFLDVSGESTDLLVTDRNYELRAYVQDSRAASTGVSQAYFDVTYDSNLISVSGDVEVGDEFLEQAGGDVSAPGLIDEVGGIDLDAPASPNDEFRLFSVPIQAESAGTVELTASLPDSPTRAPLFFLDDTAVALSEIEFVGGTIEVRAPEIVISPSFGLQTTEAGGTDTFEISLHTPPTANVTIELSSSDPTEGTVSPASVTFTTADWDTPQTVTVSGQDDMLADGNLDFQIVTEPATSGDPDYDGLDANDVFVTNFDDDSAGVSVRPTSGQTTEAGGTATFELVLDSQPTDNVVIELTSSNTDEGTIEPTETTFTPANWDAPQTITVTGQDDNVADGNISYTIVTSAAISEDGNYSGREVADVAMTNLDDDSAGILVEPTTGETDESGGMATFSISLTSQPTADVTIPLTSSDTTEGIVSVSSVTLTASNWNVAQEITVTGQDDNDTDGNVTYRVITDPATSDDPSYSNRNASDVTLINLDNDVAAVMISPTTGLVTSEAGQSAQFEMRLTSQPTAAVAIGLATSNPFEGTLDKANVLFTPANWNVSQSITVTGVDDELADGDQSYSVITANTVSADMQYHDLAVPDVQVINLDNDVANLIVTPTSGLETSEEGDQASFSVALATQPTANVTIRLSSDMPQEGFADPDEISFTPANWDQPQTITIQGVDDTLLDGDRSYQVAVQVESTDDMDYATLAPVTVSVINRDNDTAGLAIPDDMEITTTEFGGSSTFEVALTAQPDSEVTVTVASSDEGEASLSTELLTFAPANWNTPQPITVTGVDDSFVDGDVAFSVTLTPASADSAFDSLAPTSLPGTNADDDVAQLTLSTDNATVQEGTGETNSTASFQITLTGDVEGGFTVAYSTEDGTATAASGDYVDNDNVLTFAGTDGEVQTVDVEIVADNILEPDETFSVSLDQLSEISDSAAARLELLGTPLEFTILDDDLPTISFFGISMEEGTGDTPTIFQFDVEISGPVQGGLRIPYTTDDDSATVADNDYIDNDGTLEFAGLAGEVQSIEVQVLADRVVERDETFIVTLQEIVFLDPGLADSIEADGGSQVGTILNDDFATVSFVQDTSLAYETARTHSIHAVLSITNGGTLSEDVTVEFVELPGATAVAPDDYTLTSDPVITFPAGSQDGDSRSLDMQLVWEDAEEDDEQVSWELALLTGSLDGQVTIQEPNQHVMTLSEDPMTATVSGLVWFDANDNGEREPAELLLPGVQITLSGADLGNQPVSVTTMTDDAGQYRFEELPGGTYAVTENQPAAFLDGKDVLGTVAGIPAGQADNDHFSNLVLNPGQQAEGYNFGERRLAQLPMSRRLFLASTPPLEPALRDVVANAEENVGNAALAAAARREETPETRRLGNHIEVLGTNQDDQFLFVPAGHSPAFSQTQHLVSINGLEQSFQASGIETIRFDGRRGDNQVELRDSPEDDLLEARHDTAILSNTNFRLEAIAVDLVRAISASGGDDRIREEEVHFDLEREGPWIDFPTDDE